MIGLVNKMKNKTFTMLIGVSIMFMLCSCAGIDINKIKAQEVVTVVLNSYCQFPESPEGMHKESRHHEKYFESYVASGIRGTNPNIKVLPVETFREMVFDGKDFENTPRAYEDILRLAYDEQMCHKIREAKTRFIVVLDVTKSSPSGEPLLAAEEGMALIGHHWKFTIIADAHILDMKNPEKPGRCLASRDGNVCYGVMVFYVIPVPFGWYPFYAENFVFRDLGEQVGKFVEERLGLEPVAPVVIEEHEFN